MAQQIVMRRYGSNSVRGTHGDRCPNIRDRQSAHRVIIKQGYLKKLPNSAKLSASFKKPERRWFIFGIMGQQNPYLEYYENEEAIFNSSPLNILFLDDCLYIVWNQKTQRYENVFTLVLKDRKLSLVAPTRSSMHEWCRAIEDKLYSLGIIESVGGNNDYVRVPPPMQAEYVPDELEVMDLPRAPSIPRMASVEHSTPARNIVKPASTGSSNSIDDNHCYENFAPQNPNPDPYLLPSPRDIYTNGPMASLDAESNAVSVSESQMPDESSENCIIPSSSEILPPASNDNVPYCGSGISPIISMPETSQIYSKMDILQPPTYESLLNQPFPGQTTPARDPLTFPTSPVLLASPSYEESQAAALRSPECNSNHTLAALRSPECNSNHTLAQNGSLVCTNEPPPRYFSQRLLEKGANVPLKQSQSEKLTDEIASPDGLSVILKPNQCYHSLALIDGFGKVWIAGWSHKIAFLFNTQFHVGDQLLSVNGVEIHSSKVAYKLLKRCSGKADANLTIKRLPFGKVYAIDKEDQSELGLQLVAGTAEIARVDPSGPASSYGLNEEASTLERDGHCSWWITEVNNRPLNIFYKNGEVRQRLSAIGSCITFVVQPSQLVNEMKKQMKSFKNYKDYIVQ